MFFFFFFYTLEQGLLKLYNKLYTAMQELYAGHKNNVFII